MRRKSVVSTHIFTQSASEHQCCTEVISVVPRDISVKATNREHESIAVTGLSNLISRCIRLTNSSNLVTVHNVLLVHCKRVSAATLSI